MSKILVLKPKSPEVQAFVYENEMDQANLIAFVGKRPVLDIENGKTVLLYRKNKIVPGSIVFRNEFGDVVKVLTIEEMENIYDVENTYDFTAKAHVNVVKSKEIKSSAKTSDK